MTRLGSLALLAIAAPLAVWIAASLLGPQFLYNDFHSYWYAGRLVAGGTSPYDLAAMRALAASEGDVFMLGTGYSYPLPFAFAMVPFGALPFATAVTVFNVLSLAAFGAAVASWLIRLHPDADPGRVRVVAFLAGAFPPITGSVLVGQVNLLVVSALGLGTLTIVRPAGRRLAGGVAIGLAAVVKLVPVVVVAPLWLAGRRSAVAGVVAGVGLSLAVAAILRPAAILDGSPAAALFAPDPFFTNQAINGFVSRLVLSTDRLAAPALGAFDPFPVVIILTATLALATLAILWRSRTRLAESDGLALAVAFVLVGATAGAPKTSLWNESLVLPAVGLLLAVAAPRLELGQLGRVDRSLLFGWAACSVLQLAVWLLEPARPGMPGGAIFILSSLGLYGSLALWWLLGRILRRPVAAAGP